MLLFKSSAHGPACTQIEGLSRMAFNTLRTVTDQPIVADGLNPQLTLFQESLVPLQYESWLLELFDGYVIRGEGLLFFTDTYYGMLYLTSFRNLVERMVISVQATPQFSLSTFTSVFFKIMAAQEEIGYNPIETIEELDPNRAGAAKYLIGHLNAELKEQWPLFMLEAEAYVRFQQVEGLKAVW